MDARKFVFDIEKKLKKEFEDVDNLMFSSSEKVLDAMHKEKIISYIQLINTSGIGPISFKKLMNQYQNVDKALSELSQKRELFSRKKAEEELMVPFIDYDLKKILAGDTRPKKRRA